ncbi:MAG: hypothetical protein ACOY45_00965 [Pseudomonadota bacterium]
MLTAAAIFLLFQTAPAQTVQSAPSILGGNLDPVAVAARIDVTSFPNSIAPRREEGHRTFADYGFTQVAHDGPAAVLTAADGGWTFRVTVLQSSGKTVQLCILDRALNGGSYFSVKPVEFERGEDGLYHATGRAIASEVCM